MFFEESDSSNSEDEDFTVDRPSHSQNSLAMSNSMYSRIYEDVRQQIPSVEFQSLESEDELVLNGASPSSTESEDDSAVSHPSSAVDVRRPTEECFAPEGVYHTKKETSTSTVSTESAAQTPGNDMGSSVDVEKYSIGISTNSGQSATHFAVPSKVGTLSLSLNTNIEVEKLDKALEKIKESPLVNKTNEILHKSSMLQKLESHENEKDAENQLLSKLSSFSLNEKESASEMNELLSKVSSDQMQRETNQNGDDDADDDEVFKSQPLDNSLLSALPHVEDEQIENPTIYLDLRKDVQETIVKNSKESESFLKDEIISSSSSEDEDWNETRKVIKSGMNIKVARNAKETKKEKAATKHRKVVPHIDSLSNRFKRTEDMLGKTSDDRLDDVKEKSLNFDGRTDGECFDIEPLADKIRSWHQIEECTTNDKLITQRNVKTKRNNDLMCDEEFDGDVVGDDDSNGLEKKEGVYADDVDGDDGDGGLEKNLKVCEDDDDVGEAVKDTGINEHDLEYIENRLKNSKPNNDSERIREHRNKANTQAINANTIIKDSSLLKLEKYTNSIKENNYFNSSLLLTNHIGQFETGDSRDFSKVTEAKSTAENIRITDNLMLIKADISAGEKMSDINDKRIEVVADCSQESEAGIGNDKDNDQSVRKGRKLDCFKEIVSGDKAENNLPAKEKTSGNARDVESKNVDEESLLNTKSGEEKILNKMKASVLQFPKTEDIKEDTAKKPSGKSKNEEETTQRNRNAISDKIDMIDLNEIELTTFSFKSKEQLNQMKNDTDDLSNLKGLVPHVGNAEESHHVAAATGEETPLIQNEKGSRKSNDGSSGRFAVRGKKTFSEEKTDAIDHNDNSMTNKDNNPQTIKNLSEKSGSTENLTTSTKNKKKSKRKNNKYIEESKKLEVTNDSRKDDGKATVDLNSINYIITNDNEDFKKKSKSLNIKENERLKVIQRIKSLQSEYGISNIIFDEEDSFTQPFASITKSAEKSSKLLLQVNLQCPGVCDKSCGKNTLTFQERSDAYIGLCTFFLSILNGNRFNLCDSLSIPFTVVAFQQACIDSELRLFIGVVENEVSGPATQPPRRGKQRVRKNFYQTVIQYLNKTDLETVLSDLMMFDTSNNYPSSRKVYCPGNKKLSSYITVSQDLAATDRIFGLKSSLLWNRVKDNEDALSSRVTWIPVKERKNENTVVFIDNMTSLLPRFICEFMKVTRDVSLDISGIRIAYLTNSAGKEIPFLAAALRGPYITTVQIGKSFTSESRDLSTLKSSYMRADFSSCTQAPKAISVTGPPDNRPYPTTVLDPSLTYILGRGRGEREVVRWFGRRISQVSDVEIENNELAVNSKSKTAEKTRDVLNKSTPMSSMLSLSNDRVLLSISSLVPSVFVSTALTIAESRGLYPVCIGKCLVAEEDMMATGLRIETQKDDVMGDKNKKREDKKLKFAVLLVLLQGENSSYRAIGMLKALYDELNAKLPKHALMKETLHQKWNGLIRYERIQQQRHINDFFAVCPISKKIVKILDHMTSPHFSHNDNEIMSKLPQSLNHARIHEEPSICVAVFVGDAMIEATSYILNALFGSCVDDPLCTDQQATTATKDNAFVYQERPAAEIIGIKQFSCLPKHMAHVCNRFVIGSSHWLDAVQRLEKGPVVVMVIKWVRMSGDIEAYCENIMKSVARKLRSNELMSNPSSFFDAYSFSDLDTVLRIMLTMFDANELLPDSCSSWFRDTQWPIYIDRNNKLIKELDSYLGVLSNSNHQHGFKETKQTNSNDSISIIPPLTLNVPADLILASRQRSLSFIKIQVDWNFPKYLPKILNVLRRDSFRIVGLNFPGGLSPSYDNLPRMHVAVSRVNAVYRLNQWVPELTRDLHNKHILEVSGTARRAYEEIAWHFQRSETGGVFDDNPLITAEKLKFKEDDVFASKDFRRVEWNQSATAKKSSGPKEDTGKAHLKKGQLDSDCRFIMPEVNIIIMSNVLLRGSFLGQRLSENVQYLGLWEKLSSLGFKTIGARMTALKDNQAEFLLRKFDLAEKQRRALVNRLSENNGPIFALALIRDFALSNFWNILSKSVTDKELRLIQANALVPSNRDQVEVLLGSLFETLVLNSEVEIKKQTKQS